MNILRRIKSFMDEGTITIRGKEIPWAVIVFISFYMIFSFYVYYTIIFV